MGTMMELHRYSPINRDWDDKLYIVDNDFLGTYGNKDPILPTEHRYEPNKGLLKVYLNGQLLLCGGAYEEIDDMHIKLALGTFNEEDILLELGDEIYIEIYKNQYCSRGQATVSGTQMYNVQKEITDARQYITGTAPYDSLDSRLDAIQKQLDVSSDTTSDIDVTYVHNVEGKLMKEITTGSYELTREFAYYDNSYPPKIAGQLKTEWVSYKDPTTGINKQTTREYLYDDNGNVVKTQVRTR